MSTSTTTSRYAQIAAAKYGTHAIAMQPNQPAHLYVVVRVRGPFVWVQRADANEPALSLNDTASRMLLAGSYRNPGIAA